MAIFALHLSGVSSLLGAINLNLLDFNYENYNVSATKCSAINTVAHKGYTLKSSCFLTTNPKGLLKDRSLTKGSLILKANYSNESQSNKECSVQPTHLERKLAKDSNKESNWGFILGRKGDSVYVHQLAKAQLLSGKPVTFKVLNNILAYSGILVSEETLTSLINMPRLVFNIYIN